MKKNFRFRIAGLCSALIVFTLISCNPEARRSSDSTSLTEEHNKTIVTRYFQEVIDGKQYHRMPDLLTFDVMMHRPEGTLTYLDMIHATFQKALSPHKIETTIHEMVASGDYVSVRLSHRMTYSAEEAFMQSRLGLFDVRGMTIEWEAMAMFRFADGKIAEEWVSNDELGQLLQIGTLELSVKEH